MRVLDRDTVDERIRPRKIDVLKNTGGQLWRIGTLLSMELTRLRDTNGFPWKHITEKFKTQDIQRYALRSDHVLSTAPLPSRWPTTSGRIPLGSRKATRPKPDINATAA